MIEILSSASEYSELPVRHNEDRSLKQLAAHLPQKMEKPKYDDVHTKANILLQSHFSRTHLSSDLLSDQKLVLNDAIRLLQAMVDVISSNGWLKPALACMELAQMVTQGLWDRDSILLQIPHFTTDIVERCEASEEEIESVFDIMSLDDEPRDKLLQLPDHKMAAVARFCNQYPNIELKYDVQDPDTLQAGKTVNVLVQLEREIDDDAATSQQYTVHAPLYPKSKPEGWWLVIGDPKTNNLLSIKRLTMQEKSKARLNFMAPDEPGEYTYLLYFMCDSYLGCDQEYELELKVGEAGESSSEEDSDSD